MIAPDKVVTKRATNQARYEALAELYHQVALAAAIRMALGFMFTRANEEETIRRAASQEEEP